MQNNAPMTYLKDVSMVTYAYYWKLLTPTLILEHSVTESSQRETYLYHIVIWEQRQTYMPFHMKHFDHGHIRVRAAME